MSLLDAWIAPAFRDPTGLRDALERCDHAHYAVADGFFRTDRLDALIEFHRRQAFAPDDVGLHYDSTATKPTAGADPACELFFSPEWHEYAAFVTGATLASPGATTVKLRRHPERAAGFWVHTDVGHQGARKAMAVLGYFNRGWRDADGGLLQLWPSPSTASPSSAGMTTTAAASTSSSRPPDSPSPRSRRAGSSISR